MDRIPKVPKEEFDAVLSKLLKSGPLPMAEIPRKREQKAKAGRKKKRSR